MPKRAGLKKLDKIPPSDLPHVRKAHGGYWVRKCSLCGARALYRAGWKAYCKVHKAEAVKYWSAKPMRISDSLLREG